MYILEFFTRPVYLMLIFCLLILLYCSLYLTNVYNETLPSFFSMTLEFLIDFFFIKCDLNYYYFNQNLSIHHYSLDIIWIINK